MSLHISLGLIIPLSLYIYIVVVVPVRIYIYRYTRIRSIEKMGVNLRLYYGDVVFAGLVDVMAGLFLDTRGSEL